MIAFRWLDAAPPSARVTLRAVLRWQGHELGVALDGLLGLDGRLAPEPLMAVGEPLRTLMIRHALDRLAAQWRTLDPQGSSLGALASLQSIEGGPARDRLEGDWPFLVRMGAAEGVTCGVLTLPDAQAKSDLAQALARHDLALPPSMQHLSGRLRLLDLDTEALDLPGLEPGDLVWVDEALWTPAGLGVTFVSDEACPTTRAGCRAWLRRGDLVLDDAPGAAPGSLAPEPEGRKDPAAGLVVRSRPLAVPRAWAAGRIRRIRLPQTVQAMTWEIVGGDRARRQARLRVVGRRLALQVVDAPPAAAGPDASPTEH